MHKSVLLEESIKYLNLTEDKIIVDCTLGYAGHSSRILKEIKRGFLFAFDQDKEAINSSIKTLSNIGSNFEIIKSNFVYLKKELKQRNKNKVDGFLFDLGVSSMQLDEDYRGFSFHKEAELDMRMDTDKEINAKKVVNEYSVEELTDIFYKYGEEKYAKSIAKGILKYRENKEIETTLELVEIIKNSVPEKYKRDKHPARKVFQAIRIEVNDELRVFETALYDALELLNIKGRICVITFHSLEDKICKRVFNEKTKIKDELKKMPVIPEEFIPKFKLIGNVAPTKKELEDNSRSRSARLRVIEKIKD
jgi:S-adenosyl-methyltransferase MraW